MGILKSFMDENFTVKITNDDGEFYALQGMAGGLYLGVKVSDVPTSEPSYVDSLVVYLIREPQS
ncbi:MAG: hypothetical protein ACK5X3_22810 [Pseudomonadota bacterium]|jgi:hypothetical protein